jgi:hypothetical protein
VSSVRVASGELPRVRFPATPPAASVSAPPRRGAPFAWGIGIAVVVSMLVMGRDSRRWRGKLPPRGAVAEDEEEDGGPVMARGEGACFDEGSGFGEGSLRGLGGGVGCLVGGAAEDEGEGCCRGDAGMDQ